MGYHMLGFLLDTKRDHAGRSNSVFFAGTDEARLLKQAYGTKIDSQIIDLETMLRMTEIEGRQIDRGFRKLQKTFIRRPMEQKVDWGRRVLRSVFKWDVCKYCDLNNDMFDYNFLLV